MDMYPQHARWPRWAFKLPILAMMSYLSVRYRGLTLPTAANPYFQGGGLAGGSKSQILAMLSSHLGTHILNWAVQRRHPDLEETVAHALAKMEKEKVAFPVVAKPDVGRHGRGLALLKDVRDLEQYARDFPIGERFVVQNYSAAPVQAQIFFAQKPDEDHGTILSLVVKTPARVTGDGARGLRQLVLGDAQLAPWADTYLCRVAPRWNDIPAKGEIVDLSFIRNQEHGAFFTDETASVTPAMHDFWSDLARRVPGFNYGVFDVACADLAALERGEASIIDLEGAGAEESLIWTPARETKDAYRLIWDRLNLLYEIADDNRRRGHKPLGFLHMLGLWARERGLTRLYNRA